MHVYMEPAIRIFGCLSYVQTQYDSETTQTPLQMSCINPSPQSPGFEATAARSVSVQIVTQPGLSDLEGCSISFVNGTSTRNYSLMNDIGGFSCPSFVDQGDGTLLLTCLLLADLGELTDCSLDCSDIGYGTASAQNCQYN